MAKGKRKLPSGMRWKTDGCIESRFYVEGKRYSVAGASVAEVRELEFEKRKQIMEGSYTRGKDLKVSEFFERWFNSREGIVVSATLRTYRKLANRMNRQAIDKAGHRFGNIKLSSLETENVRQLQRTLQADGLSTRTTNDSISLLKHVLQAATDERILSWNPAKPVERLKRTEEQARDTIHRALTREEVETFLKAAADSWYYCLYIFLLHTGLRIGEASALSVRDVTEGYVNVWRTVTRTESAYVIAEQVKTDAARRKIDTRPEAWKAFQDQRIRNEILNRRKVRPIDAPVFTLPKGGIIRPDRVNSDIKRICGKTGIEYFTCHAFRATFASRCIAAGMDVKLLMEILGHTDVQMTLGLYGHGEDEKRRASILAVNM